MPPRRGSKRLTPAEKRRRNQSFCLMMIILLSAFAGIIIFLVTYNS